MSFMKPACSGALLAQAAAKPPATLSSGLLNLKFMNKKAGKQDNFKTGPTTQGGSSSSNSAAVAAAALAKPLSLSKSVMGMKFMKRSAETELNDREDLAKRMRVIESSWQTESVAADEWTESGGGSSSSSGGGLRYRFEDRDPVAVMPGRISMGGCNKSVERHYEQAMDAHRYEQKVARGDVITDEEFVKRYTNLIGLPGRLQDQPKKKIEKDRSGNAKKKKKDKKNKSREEA